MGGLSGYAAADLHCRAVGGSERADSGGTPSGAGGAWVGDGYVFDAAGVAGLVNHKVCEVAEAGSQQLTMSTRTGPVADPCRWPLSAQSLANSSSLYRSQG